MCIKAAGVNTGKSLKAQQQTQAGSLTWNAALAKEQKADSGLLPFASPKVAMPSKCHWAAKWSKDTHTPAASSVTAGSSIPSAC